MTSTRRTVSIHARAGLPDNGCGFVEATSREDATLDDRTLRRTIAILVSLAVLAERAVGRCFAVRWFVLAVLRHAEMVALDYVLETAPWALPYLEHESEPGSSRMDAVLLGQRLRMLAAVLGVLLPAAERLGAWSGRRDPARHGLAPGAALVVALSPGSMSALHDTS